MSAHGLVFIIAGPAGSGKTTLCHRLVSEFPNLHRIVTVTTRAPREGEVDGRDYHFYSAERFEQARQAGEFLEWAQVHGRCYGTLRSEVDARLTAKQDALLSIDVQGAESIRSLGREHGHPLCDRVVTIFILPSSLEEMRERLRRRGSDDPEEIEKRLQTAAREITHAGYFDYQVVTGTREQDFDRIRAIYIAEKNRNR